MQIVSSDPVSFNTSFHSDVTHTSPLQNMPRIERVDASPLPSDSANPSFCEEANNITESPNEPWLRRESNTTETRESITVAQKDGQPTENPEGRRLSCSSLVDLSYPGWKQWSTPAMPGRRGDDPFK